MSEPKPARPKARKLTEEEQMWKAKYELAMSLLGFRKTAMDALDAAIMEALKTNTDLVSVPFRTGGDRPASIVIAIGETAVNHVQSALFADNQESKSHE